MDQRLSPPGQADADSRSTVSLFAVIVKTEFAGAVSRAVTDEAVADTDGSFHFDIASFVF
jgi:hypothetical protein